MVKEKQEMTDHIRELVDAIKEEERNTSEMVEDVRAEGAEELKKSYVLWGEGEIARRERWVAKKTEEVRERTVKGLKPEIQRIMDQHKLDCLEVERQSQVIPHIPRLGSKRSSVHVQLMVVMGRRRKDYCVRL